MLPVFLSGIFKKITLRFLLEHNGDDVEYAMIVVDENNSTINELDSPSMKVRSNPTVTSHADE